MVKWLRNEVFAMKQKISGLPAPALAGVVREKTARAAAAEIKNCKIDGADMIDLHLSCLEKTDVDTLGSIVRSSGLPVLALHYNFTADTADAGFSEEERAACLMRAVDAGAAGVDMQGYTFHLPSKSGFCGEERYPFTAGNPKEIVTDTEIIGRQCAFIEEVHAKGAEVLLSCHPGIPMTAEQVTALALFLEERHPDVIKIVTVAVTEDDLAESVRAMLSLKKEVQTPVSYHASGKVGALSRIVNPLLGGHIAFCADRFSAGSTLEQLDLKTARTVAYNVKKLL